MTRRRIARLALWVVLGGCQLDTGGLGTGSAMSVGATEATVGGPDGLPSSGGAADTTAGPPESTSGPSTSSTGGTASGGSSSDTGEEELPPPGPFGDPERISVVNDPSANDDDPTLRSDELEMFFATDRLGDEDIYVSVRGSTALPWGVPTLVSGNISTVAEETTPELSPDGLLLLFSSDRRGNGFEVFYVARAAPGGGWSLPSPLADLSSADLELGAAVHADGATLLFCSDRPPLSGLLDIWRGTIDLDTLAVTGLARVDELATPEVDCPGNSNADMTWLFMASSRAGPGTLGLEDLWVVQRAAAGDSYLTPQHLPELNSPETDNDPWVTPDLQRIYFASDREGTFNLYVASQAEE